MECETNFEETERGGTLKIGTQREGAKWKPVNHLPYFARPSNQGRAGLVSGFEK